MTGMTVSMRFAFEGGSLGGREGGKVKVVGEKTEKNVASLPL